MKNVILVLVIFLLFPSAVAQDNYNDYSSLEIDFLLDSKIDLSGSGTLKKLTASVFLNPKDDNNQDIVSFDEFSNPTAKVNSNGELIFEWTQQSSSYDFGYNAKIKTENKIYKVPRIDIPYSDLSSEYFKYLQSEDTIDITPDIISKTSEIIENEDNAYLGVHKIADWIHTNIEYDLNTLTSKASKKSSWVLENRQGVCDELTSLFISMVRSVGIPARFVSGMAYTNLDNSFGNHGWAEVYYPDYGWVPYDVTYGQFGWIDPSHISLQKSEDVESSIVYQWQSTGDIKLDSGNDIITTAEIYNEGNKVSPIFDVSIKALEDKVAPRSYVPLRVRVKNPYDAYTSDSLLVTKAPGLTETNQKVIAMKPLEEKELYWIVEIPDRALSNYVYTTTIEIVDLFGSSDSTTIEYKKGYEEITLSEAEGLVDQLMPGDENKYANQIVLNCNPSKNYFYSFEDVSILCNVRTFNSNINDLSLCVKNSCEDFDMGSNLEKEFSFAFSPTENIVPITLKNDEIDIKRNILLSVYEKPEIKISKIPITVINYNEEIEIPLTLHSDTPIEDITLSLNKLKPNIIEDLEGTKELTLSLNSKYLNSEKIKIKLEFLDEYGNSYEQEYVQDITVNNLPWYWRIINLFRG